MLISLKKLSWSIIDYSRKNHFQVLTGHFIQNNLNDTTKSVTFNSGSNPLRIPKHTVPCEKESIGTNKRKKAFLKISSPD